MARDDALAIRVSTIVRWQIIALESASQSRHTVQDTLREACPRTPALP